MLPDFGSVTAAKITTKTRAAIAAADDLVAEAVTPNAAHTYEGVLGRLDAAAAVIADADGYGPFLSRVHPKAEVRRAGLEARELLTKWSTDLVFRDDVAQAIRRYAAGEDAATLRGPRRRLLDDWLRDLLRAGHDLAAQDRIRLQQLRNRLVELQVGFDANLDRHEDWIELQREDLDGLPSAYVGRLAPGDLPGTLRVTMDYPDYQPFMRQAHRRDLRERLQNKFWNRAVDANRPLLEEAIRIRSEIASLLGYSSWADYSTEVKMAGSASAVEELYESLIPGLDRKAVRELAALDQIADGLEGGVKSWDFWYLDDRQRRTRFSIDEDEVASYFPLEQVLSGLFDVTGHVFGLEYRQIEDPSVWHPDVALYEIRDAGADAPLAYFYADLFPREGKYGHAAAFAITYGRRDGDGYRAPVAAIVANVTKPVGDTPSLLRHDEVVTLFHEFGHVLHFCLTKVEIVRYSGYEAEWDFVEAPSQIMEHWTWQPDVLARFAFHHESGEPIPDELVRAMVAARDLNIAMLTLRQVFLGRLDLGLHRYPPPENLDAVYRTTYAYTKLPFHEGTFFPASFGHLMGGYDAGYYGYLWSEVYGDDMFSVFEDEGVMDPDVGARYRREVLETGGSRDAIEHLRGFLGREPSSDAFLARLGLGGAGAT